MRFAVNISEVSGAGYRAQCPSLPGCTVFGRSPDEARQQATRAILGYLASLDVAVPPELEVDVPKPPGSRPFRVPVSDRLSDVA